LQQLVGDVEAALAGTRIDFPRASLRTPVLDPRVRVSRGGASARGEIIDVSAPDRPGLLSDLAEAIFENGYSITVARITTEGARAVDAFYVTQARPDAPAYDDLCERIAAIVGRER
jgi:[protein-PII] uridylyltransferase